MHHTKPLETQPAVFPLCNKSMFFHLQNSVFVFPECFFKLMSSTNQESEGGQRPIMETSSQALLKKKSSEIRSSQEGLIS